MVTVAAEHGVASTRGSAAVLLTVLAAVLWSVGWLVAKVSLAASWVAAAVELGWRDAHTNPPRRD